MAEHYCEEHDVAFTQKTSKKDGDTFWSHQTEDGWCNEPKEKKPKAKPKSDDMSKDDWTEKDRVKSASIEIQNAYTGVPALVNLLKTYPDDLLLLAAYNYAMSKLGNWSSQGISPEPTSAKSSPPEEETEPSTLVTSDTLVKLEKRIVDSGYTSKEATGIILGWEWKKPTAWSKLTEDQAIVLIEYLEKNPKKAEPEDIPF